MTDKVVIGILLLAIAAGVVAIAVEIVRRGVGSLLPRGELAEVSEDLDERPVRRGVTVPPTDGSHDHLPEDKATDGAFWALAKTAGIEVTR